MIHRESRQRSPASKSFLEAARKGDAAPWTKGTAEETPDAKKLRESLDNLSKQPEFPKNAHMLENWLPRVARFLFNAALELSDAG